MRPIFHIILIILLTITTQVGGLVYLFSILFINNKKKGYKAKRVFLFTILYTITTFLLVPKIATHFGRVKIEDHNSLEAHNFITKLCNRNYVSPKLNNTLNNITLQLVKEHPNLKVIYLDANFPFFNGFPLLPHLSHNDGKKIDLSFIYENQDKTVTNLKPSFSGYGIFVKPTEKEFKQTNYCKSKGYWQYDFTKYLSFGNINKELKISENTTKYLLNIIAKNKDVSKIFIEPHLKSRLKINNQKIRFHGCKAVRHDDHIHFQIN